MVYIMQIYIVHCITI